MLEQVVHQKTGNLTVNNNIYTSTCTLILQHIQSNSILLDQFANSNFNISTTHMHKFILSIAQVIKSSQLDKTNTHTHVIILFSYNHGS